MGICRFAYVDIKSIKIASKLDSSSKSVKHGLKLNISRNLVYARIRVVKLPAKPKR